MAPSAGPLESYTAHSRNTSVYLPQARVWVAGNPKAAGTSLRWWLLRAAGIDVDAVTRGSLWGESSPAQVVWARNPALRYTWEGLTPQERQEAERGHDVLRVLPVRHPSTRVFATWSSKFLIGEPGYEERLPRWMPRLPERVESEAAVWDAFGAFVLALAGAEAEWSTLDVHLWPQHLLLHRALAADHVLVRQERLDGDLVPVRARLRDAGLEPGALPTVNEAATAYRADCVTPDVHAALIDLYAGDFDQLSYGPDDVPAGRTRAVDVRWINDVRGRNRRFGQVVEEARRHQRESARLADEVTSLRDQRDALARREAELMTSTSWRLTAPMRRAVDNGRRLRTALHRRHG